MFSIRRPRNLIAGISSGCKSFLKGSASGFVGLIAAPIYGLREQGFQGMCSGFVNGVVGAIALPATGAAVATLQIGRGLINSAEAVVESSAGKDWDQEKRVWYEYNLQVEAQKVAALDEFAVPMDGSPGSPGASSGSRLLTNGTGPASASVSTRRSLPVIVREVPGGRAMPGARAIPWLEPRPGPELRWAP